MRVLPGRSGFVRADPRVGRGRALRRGHDTRCGVVCASAHTATVTFVKLPATRIAPGTHSELSRFGSRVSKWSRYRHAWRFARIKSALVRDQRCRADFDARPPHLPRVQGHFESRPAPVHRSGHQYCLSGSPLPLPFLPLRLARHPADGPLQDRSPTSVRSFPTPCRRGFKKWRRRNSNRRTPTSARAKVMRSLRNQP